VEETEMNTGFDSTRELRMFFYFWSNNLKMEFKKQLNMNCKNFQSIQATLTIDNVFLLVFKIFAKLYKAA